MARYGEFLNAVVCPHCKHENEAWPATLKNDGDEAEMCCCDCDKPMQIQLCIEPLFRTRKLPERMGGND